MEILFFCFCACFLCFFIPSKRKTKKKRRMLTHVFSVADFSALPIVSTKRLVASMILIVPTHLAYPTSEIPVLFGFDKSC